MNLTEFSTDNIDVDKIMDKMETVLANIIEMDEDLYLEPFISFSVPSETLIYGMMHDNDLQGNIIKVSTEEELESFFLSDELANGFQVHVYADELNEYFRYDSILSFDPYGDTIFALKCDELMPRD